MAVRVYRLKYALLFGLAPVVLLSFVLVFVAVRKYSFDTLIDSRIAQIEGMAISVSNDNIRVIKAVDILARIHAASISNTLYSTHSSLPSANFDAFGGDYDIFAVPTNFVYAAGTFTIANGVPLVSVGQFVFYPGCVFRGAVVVSVDAERVVFSNGQVLLIDSVFQKNE